MKNTLSILSLIEVVEQGNVKILSPTLKKKQKNIIIGSFQADIISMGELMIVLMFEICISFFISKHFSFL